MEDSGKPLFREESLKRAAEPEQLNRYLKVTEFGPWMVILAGALVLAAVFVWSFFGVIRTTVEGAGYCKDGVITCYFSQETADNIPRGATVDIHGNTGIVTDAEGKLTVPRDIPNDVLFLLSDTHSEWYYAFLIDCDLPDGLYSVKYYGEEIHPISFLMQGQ